MIDMDELINAGQPFLGSTVAEQGISAPALKALISTHRLRRVFRDVYVDAAVSDTRALRAASLHLVKPPQGVFYGLTVAFLLGVDAFPPRARFTFVPECVVPHHSTRCTRLFVRCREGYLPSADLDDVDGLPVTNSIRTTVDMLRTLWRPHALAAADAMAHAGLVTRPEVMSHIARMKRFPGIVQARCLAPLIDYRAESSGESWQRLRMIDAGLPIPESQIKVLDRAGVLRARLDNGYSRAKVGVEYDGREFHSEDDDKEHDEKRREYLEDTHGWRICVARREDIFGDDPAFEIKIGSWIGIPPQLPRRW